MFRFLSMLCMSISFSARIFHFHTIGKSSMQETQDKVESPIEQFLSASKMEMPHLYASHSKNNKKTFHKKDNKLLLDKL